MENRGVVVWDVHGTLGTEERSVLKNVGLVWIDNICNLLCQGALLSWVNDDFLSEPNERIVLRHQATQTWRDKPAVAERVALNNVFLWASKPCLVVMQRGPRRFTSPENPERLFFVTGHLGPSGEGHHGKKQSRKPQGNTAWWLLPPAEECLYMTLGTIFLFFKYNNLQLLFKDFQDSGK